MDRGVNESTQPSDLRAKAIGKSRMMLTTAVSNLTCSWSLRLRFKRQRSKWFLSFLFSVFLFCCTFPVGLALCWHQRLGITCLGGPWKCFLTVILQRLASAFLHLHWGSLSQCIFSPWCLTALYQLPACRGAAEELQDGLGIEQQLLGARASVWAPSLKTDVGGRISWQIRISSARKEGIFPGESVHSEAAGLGSPRSPSLHACQFCWQHRFVLGGLQSPWVVSMVSKRATTA